MAAPLQPYLWFVFRLALVPSGSGTTIYRWATVPMADVEWKEARLLQWGTIDRSLSTVDGDYDVASLDLTLDDSDGVIRGLLAQASTKYWTSREGEVLLLSAAGRAANLTPRSLWRGFVTDVQAKPGRKVTMRVADAIGSHFSGFDLDKLIPQPRILRREHPGAPDKTVGRVYPIIIGEHSDLGALDVNGQPADKGLLPVIDVGDVVVASDGSTVAPDVAPTFLAAPATVSAALGGTAGTTARSYAVTAVSPYGETLASSIVTIANSPDILSGTDTVTITWGASPGAVEYRVYGRTYGQQLHRLASLNNLETWTNPETTWTDDGSVREGAQTPPPLNTAQVEQVLPGGATAFGWARFVLALGSVDVHTLYASDLAAGGSPKRVRMNADVFGADFLVPGFPGWPHADPYIEIGGIRQTVIYGRGPRVEAHRSGAVTIAWNGCGAEDVGDGSGTMIDEAFPALQWMLNEHVLKNDGSGYLTGTYGPLVTYANGDSVLKTTAFASCQTITEGWMGTGYKAAWALFEPLSLREFLRRFCQTFACHLGADHFGRVFPVLIDDTANPTAGRLYRDRIEIQQLVDQQIDHDAVETRIVYHYDWDTDAGRFRITDQVLEDIQASDAHLSPRQKAVRQLYYTRDSATAIDACGRHLSRYKIAPRYLTFQTDYTGLEDEHGSQVRVTHYDGLGASGDVETPMLVMKHRVKPSSPEVAILTCFDLGRILNSGAPLLSEPGFNLGDEASQELPPVGAYELR